MFQLQSSHHQAVCVRSIKGNHISVVYILLKMINGGHLGLTHKVMLLLHIKNNLQYKKHCMKLNNCVI
jgi:hypothetical protein